MYVDIKKGKLLIMNINPVTANVKSYAYNNSPKKAERTFSSNPVQQTVQENSMQKLNINNVQSKLNISFRGKGNSDSKSTQRQKLFDILRQIDPDKANKAFDEAQMAAREEARMKEILDCRIKLRNYKLHCQYNNICQNMSEETMKKIAKYIPDEFEAAILWQDDDGTSAFHGTFSYNDLDKIAHAQPQVFSKALLLKDKQGETPVHKMSHHYCSFDKDKMELMANTAPHTFGKTLTIQNKYGETPLNIIAQNKHSEVMDEMLIIMAEKAPKYLGKAMIIQDKRGKTPLHYMERTMVGIAAQAAPEEFKKAVLTEDDEGKTPLYYYTQREDIAAILSVAENAPDEFYRTVNEYNIFEKITELCLKDPALLQAINN